MAEPDVIKVISRKITCIAVKSVALLLALAIAGLLFIYFSPNYSLYLITTGSMAPAIEPGDIIVTGRVNVRFPVNLEPGRIITFKQNNVIVAHRIVSVSNGVILTKGDANESMDPHPLVSDTIDGIYLFKIPLLGYINSLVTRTIGWFVAIIIPLIILIIFTVKKHIKDFI